MLDEGDKFLYLQGNLDIPIDANELPPGKIGDAWTAAAAMLELQRREEAAKGKEKKTGIQQANEAATLSRVAGIASTLRRSQKSA